MGLFWDLFKIRLYARIQQPFFDSVDKSINQIKQNKESNELNNNLPEIKEKIDEANSEWDKKRDKNF